MNIYMTAFAALLLWGPVLADDASARAQLIGAWQQQDDSGKGISVWVVEAKGGSYRWPPQRSPNAREGAPENRDKAVDRESHAGPRQRVLFRSPRRTPRTSYAHRTR